MSGLRTMRLGRWTSDARGKAAANGASAPGRPRRLNIASRCLVGDWLSREWLPALPWRLTSRQMSSSQVAEPPWNGRSISGPMTCQISDQHLRPGRPRAGCGCLTPRIGRSACSPSRTCGCARPSRRLRGGIQKRAAAIPSRSLGSCWATPYWSRATALSSIRPGPARHPRFILRLANEQTVLIAHNVDLAPRVTDLKAR
jgi:hypothetical protein